jgi:hypothetical protein
MNSQTYWYRASRRNIVRISESNNGRWGVYLNEKLICDSFGSAEEAAESANRKRFDSEAAAAGFGGSYVPWDLNLWSKSPPEEPLEPEVSAETNPSECKNRPWQHGRNRF